MADNRVEILLKAKDELTRSLNQATAELKKMREATAQAGKVVEEAGAAHESLGSSLAKTIGVYALLTAAAYKAGQAMVFGFKEAIKANEEFEMQSIKIGVGLTNMTEGHGGLWKDVFEANRQYAGEMYEAIRREDEKAASSAQDMMGVYNALVQQGYAVRLDEVAALRIITDKIWMATQGQNFQVQQNQEIRALMQGQADAHSAIAMELKTRLGPAWAEIVQEHKKAGDLLKWMAELWPGIEVASERVSQTLQAQTTTLQGNLKYLAQEGMKGAYDDIVGLVKSINDYLREHAEELAVKLRNAWADIREILGGIYAALQGINDLLTVMLAPMRALVEAAKELSRALQIDEQNFQMLRAFLRGDLAKAQASAAERYRLEHGGRGLSPFMDERGRIRITPEILAGRYAENLPKLTIPGLSLEQLRESLGLKTRQPPGPEKPEGAGAGVDVDKELEDASQETEKARLEALRAANEAFRTIWDVQREINKFYEDMQKMEAEAVAKSAHLWQEAMEQEKLSYQERLNAAEQFRQARLQTIEKEIEDLRRQYRGRIPEAALEAYRRAQTEAMDKKISQATQPAVLDWEAAWKRAAENVQDALANTIYNLVTQTKTAGDVLKNLLNGILQIMSQMAAQAVMNMVKGAMAGKSMGGMFGGSGGSMGGSLSGLGSMGFDFLNWIGLGELGWGLAGSSGIGALSIAENMLAVVPFQHGGIVTKPTLAMIGEAGPEAVIPLSKSGSKTDAGVTHQYNITIKAMDGADVQRVLEKHGDVLFRVAENRAKNYRRVL